jgi:hypothetical protein
MNLEELKQSRDSIDNEIKMIEALMDQQLKDSVLKNYYVKVVCPICEGDGYETIGGRDIESDPPELSTCTGCFGKAFLWARKFNGKGAYSLEFSEVCC